MPPCQCPATGCFVRYKQQLFNKRELSDKLSTFDESLGDNALEAFISRLRKKLAGSGAAIRTLRGIGYLMEAEP